VRSRFRNEGILSPTFTLAHGTHLSRRVGHALPRLREASTPGALAAEAAHGGTTGPGALAGEGTLKAVPDNLTREQRSRAMARIKRRDTQPELLLRRALWSAGWRGYRVDDGRLPGRPDIAWTRHRVAVFIDGAFWHGHPSAYTPGQHGIYWDEKVARNCERDRLANAALTAMGWRVLRFWDFDVRKELAACLAEVARTLRAAANPASGSSAQRGAGAGEDVIPHRGGQYLS
jgi:DNA mismatch endonuclease (patch repair protein)